MKRSISAIRWAAAAACLSFLLGATVPAWSTTAPDMAYYTSQPAFLNNVVPPDILFILDISEAMLPAAYGTYPESSTASNGKMFISSNIAGSSIGSGSNPDTVLCNTNDGAAVAGCPTAIGVADAFNSSKEYFGMFNPKRCYTYSNPSFVPARTTDKSSTSPCPNSTEWDGNFLNWLTMRKIDLAKKALVGGNGSSAQCNNSAPFDCNKLFTETVTKGSNSGNTNNCSGKSDFCYAYVKATTPPAYPSGITSGYYYPSSMPTNGSSRTYFGIAGGSLYASGSQDATAIFSSAVGNIQVDLTSETTAVQGEQSTGLFQQLRYDQMRVAVMFTNTNGVAGSVTMYFDQKLTSSITNNIRNQAIGPNAALAETLYEALCYFNQQQSSGCYSNTPADYASTTSAAGDPYFFCTTNDTSGKCTGGKMVPCCKGYVLMISSGVPANDGNSPTKAQFGDLMSKTVSNQGVTTSQLDDVAYYGKLNDLRSDLTKTQNVTFYAVNAMGGSNGATLLASASKWGGFEDSNANKLPDATGQTCTYPTGSNLGTAGTSGTSNQEWDRDPLDCEPDTYFDASEGSSLAEKILAAIQSILKKSASGTAASVLASSSTGEGAMYQAFFYPKDPHAASTSTDVVYTGYTTSFFIDSYGNFREDTDGDGRMVYGVDDIVRLRYDAGTEEVMVDRYKDVLPADGIADSVGGAPPVPYYSKPLKDTTVLPLWEAGDSLADLNVTKSCSTADAGVTCRRIWTWIDTDNDGLIDSTENMEEFIPTNTRLAPYLNAGKSSLTTTQVINFIRGCDPKDCAEQASLRERHVTNVAGVTKLWRLGDPINSTPTVVGAPRERYDLIYGDLSYTAFYQRYKDRRQVVYLGANDGMLHAFNAGFYHKGDDPATATVTEHGWFTTDSKSAPTASTPRNDPPRGAELWAYIPYSLLPQLQWLARTDYVHSYYVDLKPKVTDVRIFTDDGATGRHPGGWGTILIGGFRLGGSCGNCTTADGAPPMTFTATFETKSEDRSFYSGYFVMDITDPEREPELIAVFTNQSGLGLTNSYPTVLRVNTKALSDKTAPDNAKWFAVFGSGMTGYKGTTNLSQQSQFYTLELKGDKTSTAKGPISTLDKNAFMGDLISFDANLDYRVDAIYGGNTICNDSKSPATCSGAGGSLTPNWIGKMYRFTTGDGVETDPAKWTLPSVVVQEFSCTPAPSCTGATKVGPVTGAPSITSDDSNNVWVFFGTGRYWDPIADKANTDTQYFIGVKDQVPRGICKLSTTDCQLKNLQDVSSVVLCSVCSTITQVSGGPTGVTTFDALVKAMTSKEGWYTTLPTAGERNLSSPTLLGGTLLFTTFVPSADICVVQGTGSLYALFYLTGSAYPDPLVGTTASGTNVINNRSISLGTGLPSSVAVQLTKQGSGSVGGTGGPSPCAGGLNAVIQGSTGEVHQVCGKPALSAWSRYLSWMNNRDS